MAKEIERKFLVTGNLYKEIALKKEDICQGYLNRDPERTVRVRKIGTQGRLTVKGKNHGIERLEFEYEIPGSDAEQMLGLCQPPLLDKTRWYVRGEDGHMWEVDEFHGEAAPLVLAEIELEDVEETFVKPDFIGEEVSGNPKYYNSSLAK